jgi:hypothetical protein
MMRVCLALLLSVMLSAPVLAQPIAQGSIGASGGVVVTQPPVNLGSLLVQVTGTWSATLTFEGSVDGSTFVSLNATNVATSAGSTTTTANGVFAVSSSGLRFFRLRATAYTSGTAVVTISAGPGGGAGGGGSSGSVTQGTSPWIVAGEYANDGVAAGTNRVNTNPGIVETAAPSRTNGRNAGFSFTAGGAARVMITDAVGAATSIATDATHDSSASTTGPQQMNVAAAFGTLPSAVTAADAVRAASDLQGVSYVRSPNNPCDGATVTTLAISSAADAVLISASASNRTYICDGFLLANAAEIVALWEGTGSTCGTSSAALVGSTTIANGVSLAANGGVPLRFIRGNSTNVDICLHLNTTNRVTGYITYVQAP